MPAAYGRALLAVCRSGATSIAELVASGTPSVLVPYPLAAADHQTGNARTLERAGAAVVVADDDECAKGITAALVRLLGDRAALGSMAEAARSLARPGAARRVVEVAEELARRR